MPKVTALTEVSFFFTLLERYCKTSRSVFVYIFHMTRPMQTEPITYTLPHTSGGQAPFYAARKIRSRLQHEGSTYLWPFKSSPPYYFPLKGFGWGEGLGIMRFVDPGVQDLIWCCQNRAEFLKGISLAVAKLSRVPTRAFQNHPRWLLRKRCL